MELSPVTIPLTLTALLFCRVNFSSREASFADFDTTACPWGSFKPTSGNAVLCTPWSSVGGCPPGQQFVEGNITHDSRCQLCEPGYFQSSLSLTPCAVYPVCPSFSLQGDSPVVTYNFSGLGQAVSLVDGPGYTRNSSVLLWCYPDGSWKSVVVQGTPASSVDPYAPRPRPYLSSVGWVEGKVFLVTMVGKLKDYGTCFGTDVYYNYYPYISHCAVHAGVLGIGQRADVLALFVNNKKGTYVASLRNGIQSHAHPGNLYGVTFLSSNSSTRGEGFADFKTTACPFGWYKPKSGNHACQPWSSVGGCPVGQGFVAGNITHDSRCEACAQGSYNNQYNQFGCSAYPTCSPLRNHGGPVSRHHLQLLHGASGGIGVRAWVHPQFLHPTVVHL